MPRIIGKKKKEEVPSTCIFHPDTKKKNEKPNRKSFHCAPPSFRAPLMSGI